MVHGPRKNPREREAQGRRKEKGLGALGSIVRNPLVYPCVCLPPADEVRLLLLYENRDINKPTLITKIVEVTLAI